MSETLAARLDACVQSLPADKRAEVLEDASRYCKYLQQKIGLPPAWMCQPAGLEFTRSAAFAAGVRAAAGIKPQLLFVSENGLQDLPFFQTLAQNPHASYHHLAYAYLGFLQGFAKG